MTPNGGLLASTGTDIGTLAVVGVGVLAFLGGLLQARRESPDERIEDLVRQRDEARQDLQLCERENRQLRRVLREKNGDH